MNDLMIFNNKEFGQIRTVEIDGKPYFVGKDVANALGYSNPRDAISRHCKGVAVLGGKHSEAYKDTEIRSKVYRDIYDQVKREFGIYDDSGRPQSYKALKRKYIADAHELIDCYEVPTYLEELISEANAQMDLGIV